MPPVDFSRPPDLDRGGLLFLCRCLVGGLLCIGRGLNRLLGTAIRRGRQFLQSLDYVPARA